MKKVVCRKCGWFSYNPNPKDDSKCVNCSRPYNYKTDFEEDNIKALPIDWSKEK